MSLDRQAPRQRPDLPRSGVQRWRELLFVHYTFDADAVRALLPAGLELDTWQGKAWVGVVPFAMLGVRPSWLPVGLSFLETNVRTYVHHQGKPGVYFFSLEAGSWLAVQAARIGWGLPYFHARMHCEREGRRLRYHSERRASGPARALSADYEHADATSLAAPGSLDEFLLERYLLFSEHRGRLSMGQVHHAPYPMAEVTLHAWHDTLVDAVGEPSSRRPAAVHYSPGVDVEVFGPWPV